MSNKLVCYTVPEVMEVVESLKAKNMNGLVAELEDGTYEVSWCESKYYRDSAGNEHLDAVWFDQSGNLISVQDMPVEMLQALAREAIAYKQHSGEADITSDIQGQELDEAEIAATSFKVPGNETRH